MAEEEEVALEVLKEEEEGVCNSISLESVRERVRVSLNALLIIIRKDRINFFDLT